MGFTYRAPGSESVQVQMALKTTKIRRGDTVVEQVADKERPYREVTLTSHPEAGEVEYLGHRVPVRYLSGVDSRTGRPVKYTGTEHMYWQVVRTMA